MSMDEFKHILPEYEKFWERKNIDRPILNFSYEKNNGVTLNAPTGIEQQWLDEEFIVENYKRYLASVGFIAEGYPSLFTNFGPGCLAACIGGSFEVAPHTVWFDKEPIVTDWENPPEIALDPASPMWQHLVRHQNRFLREENVDFSITDLGGIMDVVASLRSTEALLYDLYDYPDEVIEFTQKVKALWFDAFDQQVEMLKRNNQPYVNWMNIPSSKPWYPLQCDFCYMISPEHFRKFVLGDLIDQTNHMPRSIYHLDGVGEFPHLDMLLDIEKLNGIQWVPGDGQAPVWDERWLPLYRKIQDKNKNIVLLDAIDENDPGSTERLIKSIDPKGVFLSARFSSKEKAEETLENIIKWSV